MRLQYNQKIKEFNVLENENDVIFTSNFGSFEIKPQSSFELSSFESFLFDQEVNTCSFLLKEEYILENKNR
jgi:hypothetical protein